MGGCSEFGDSVKALPASAAKMALREPEVAMSRSPHCKRMNLQSLGQRASATGRAIVFNELGTQRRGQIFLNHWEP